MGTNGTHGDTPMPTEDFMKRQLASGLEFIATHYAKVSYEEQARLLTNHVLRNWQCVLDSLSRKVVKKGDKYGDPK